MTQEVEEEEKKKTKKQFPYVSQTSTGCAKAADNLAVTPARLG